VLPQRNNRPENSGPDLLNRHAPGMSQIGNLSVSLP
jgi:hypothetical protein